MWPKQRLAGLQQIANPHPQSFVPRTTHMHPRGGVPWGGGGGHVPGDVGRGWAPPGGGPGPDAPAHPSWRAQKVGARAVLSDRDGSVPTAVGYQPTAVGAQPTEDDPPTPVAMTACSDSPAAALRRSRTGGQPCFDLRSEGPGRHCGPHSGDCDVALEVATASPRSQCQ